MSIQSLAFFVVQGKEFREEEPFGAQEENIEAWTISLGEQQYIDRIIHPC